MKRQHTKLSLIIMLFFINEILATSYAPPHKRKVFSQNNLYYLLVNPDDNTNTVYDIKQKKVLWSFKRGLWHCPAVVSNDGSKVAIISWRHVQDINGVEEKPIINKVAITIFEGGLIRKSFKFKEIFPNPPQTKNVGIGPIGDFWRTWYYDVAVADNNFTLLLTNKKEITISLDNSEIKPDAKTVFPKRNENTIKVIKLPDENTDQDGLTDREEIKFKLNPKIKDTHLDYDEDGFTNLEEVESRTDPINPGDYPSIIKKVKLLSIEGDSVKIKNTLTNETFTLKLNETLELKGKIKGQQKIKVKKIEASQVTFIDFHMRRLVTIEKD